LVIISYTPGLFFALERIGPLAAIIIIVFYLLVLYLSVSPNTPENPFASIYSESLIKTASQHLLLLIGFDTLIYRKYYDTPPILVGHQLSPKPASINLQKWFLSPTGRLNLGFILRKTLPLCSSYLLLGVPNCRGSYDTYAMRGTSRR
jgi:hypothetical protein